MRYELRVYLLYDEIKMLFFMLVVCTYCGNVYGVMAREVCKRIVDLTMINDDKFKPISSSTLVVHTICGESVFLLF